MIQRLLYEMVIVQGNEEDFIILEEVCRADRPDRSIAIDSNENADCYFVLPERYGGNFKQGK